MVARYACQSCSNQKYRPQKCVLRRIERVSRLDRVTNVDVREKLQQEGVLGIVKSGQEKWKIIMEEMSLERTTKKIFVHSRD